METMTREVLSPTGITVRTRKSLSCHKDKINQTHLIVTGKEGAGIMNGGSSLQSTAYMGDAGGKYFKADDKADRKLTCPC